MPDSAEREDRNYETKLPNDSTKKLGDVDGEEEDEEQQMMLEN